MFCLNLIIPCDITEYCILGLKTTYSNFKVFIFQLICILAKMIITFESVGIFSCGFRCCTQENKFCHLSTLPYGTKAQRLRRSVNFIIGRTALKFSLVCDRH